MGLVSPREHALLSSPTHLGQAREGFALRQSVLTELSSPQISGVPEICFPLRKSGTLD